MHPSPHAGVYHRFFKNYMNILLFLYLHNQNLTAVYISVHFNSLIADGKKLLLYLSLFVLGGIYLPLRDLII